MSEEPSGLDMSVQLKCDGSLCVDEVYAFFNDWNEAWKTNREPVSHKTEVAIFNKFKQHTHFTLLETIGFWMEDNAWMFVDYPNVWLHLHDRAHPNLAAFDTATAVLFDRLGPSAFAHVYDWMKRIPQMSLHDYCDRLGYIIEQTSPREFPYPGAACSYSAPPSSNSQSFASAQRPSATVSYVPPPPAGGRPVSSIPSGTRTAATPAAPAPVAVSAPAATATPAPATVPAPAAVSVATVDPAAGWIDIPHLDADFCYSSGEIPDASQPKLVKWVNPYKDAKNKPISARNLARHLKGYKPVPKCLDSKDCTLAKDLSPEQLALPDPQCSVGHKVFVPRFPLRRAWSFFKMIKNPNTEITVENESRRFERCPVFCCAMCGLVEAKRSDFFRHLSVHHSAMVSQAHSAKEGFDICDICAMSTKGGFLSVDPLRHLYVPMDQLPEWCFYDDPSRTHHRGGAGKKHKRDRSGDAAHGSRHSTKKQKRAQGSKKGQGSNRPRSGSGASSPPAPVQPSGGGDDTANKLKREAAAAKAVMAAKDPPAVKPAPAKTVSKPNPGKSAPVSKKNRIPRKATNSANATPAQPDTTAADVTDRESKLRAAAAAAFQVAAAKKALLEVEALSAAVKASSSSSGCTASSAIDVDSTDDSSEVQIVSPTAGSAAATAAMFAQNQQQAQKSKATPVAKPKSAPGKPKTVNWKLALRDERSQTVAAIKSLSKTVERKTIAVAGKQPKPAIAPPVASASKSTLVTSNNEKTEDDDEPAPGTNPVSASPTEGVTAPATNTPAPTPAAGNAPPAPVTDGSAPDTTAASDAPIVTEEPDYYTAADADPVAIAEAAAKTGTAN